MDLVSTRHFGLGLAGALTDPAFAVARAAAAGWETPLAAPVRRPAGALAKAAARRGALDEPRLRAAAGQVSSDWLERALGVLIEARLLERVAGDSVERLLAPTIERAVSRALMSPALEQRITAVLERPAPERVLASAIVESVTEQALASEELRDALVTESHGLGDELRDETGMADDPDDGVARRLFRPRQWLPPLASFDEGPAPA